MLSTLAGGTSDRFAHDLAEVAEVIDLLERQDDRVGLAQAWLYAGQLEFYGGNCARALSAYERAIPLAREAQLRRDERHCRDWWLAAKRYGPTPVREALAAADEVIAATERDGTPAATAQLIKVALLAMDGDLEVSRELVERAVSIAAQLGLVPEMMVGMEGSQAYSLAGDQEAAEHLLRRCWDTAGAIGETGFRATIGTMLAESLLELRRLEEAQEILAEVESFMSSDDFDPQVRLRRVRALMLVEQGRFDEADRLTGEAVAIADATDYFEQRGDAHETRGRVLAAARRLDEAEAEWRTALDLYERKGHVVRAGQVRERLAA